MASGLWRVLYEPARDRWVFSEGATTEQETSVEEWVEQCTLFGPPGPSDNDPDAEYESKIAPFGLTVAFYVRTHERLIIVRTFSG